MYQNITLHILNIHNVICQLYLNKPDICWYLCGKQTLKRVFSDSHLLHANCRVKLVSKKSTEVIFAKISLNVNILDMQSD